MKRVKCLACGREAICDDYGYQTNFCSQRCAESNVQWDNTEDEE